jgi:type IV pilus assembly protein PilX
MQRITLARERGVVLIFTLIVLLIMTIGAVALLRSMNSSLFSAGNLAFRHDLVNQGEQAVSNVLQAVQTGLLVTATTADLPAANYSASALPTNAQGVPTALLSTNPPTIIGGGDITGATSDVKIRYVVDRLCNAAGAASTTSCVQSVATPPGNAALQTPGIAPPTATVYRLSVRVTGPRATQIFLQTSFTKPN